MEIVIEFANEVMREYAIAIKSSIIWILISLAILACSLSSLLLMFKSKDRITVLFDYLFGSAYTVVGCSIFAVSTSHLVKLLSL